MIDERQTTIEDLPEVEVPVEGLFSGEVHTAAAVFPMMTDAELDDLAADIKENGLVHPIALDRHGSLLDGRNRLDACRRAGVAPVFRMINDVDPVEFIGSANDGKRRRMNQGQIAMCYVEMYWDPERFKLKHSVRYVAQKAGVNHARIGQACAVIQFTPWAVSGVKTGSKPLSVAYEEACAEKQRQEDERTRQESDDAKLERLSEEYPDLAVMVREEALTLAGALAEASERQRQQEEQERKEREYLELRTRQFDTALSFLDPRAMPVDQLVSTWQKIDPSVIGETADFSAGRARRVAEALLRYAEVKEGNENGEATVARGPVES